MVGFANDPSRNREEVAAKFDLGQVVITQGAKAIVDQEETLTLLNRHIAGDWGDLCEEDRIENESALTGGNRLFSVYQTKSADKVYIITEWDRSVTTILLPEEY